MRTLSIIGQILFPILSVAIVGAITEDADDYAVVGAVILTLFGLVLSWVGATVGHRYNEFKKNPSKNLEVLRDKNIISQVEYEEKILQANDLDNKNRVKAEQEKLLSELDNLKEKGILTDAEYQQKWIKIKDMR